MWSTIEVKCAKCPVVEMRVWHKYRSASNALTMQLYADGGSERVTSSELNSSWKSMTVDSWKIFHVIFIQIEPSKLNSPRSDIFVLVNVHVTDVIIINLKKTSCQLFLYFIFNLNWFTSLWRKTNFIGKVVFRWRFSLISSKIPLEYNNFKNQNNLYCVF